jgi:hypothetical protein
LATRNRRIHLMMRGLAGDTTAVHDNIFLIGGYCVESPYYHPQPTRLLRHCP